MTVGRFFSSNGTQTRPRLDNTPIVTRKSKIKETQARNWVLPPNYLYFSRWAKNRKGTIIWNIHVKCNSCEYCRISAIQTGRTWNRTRAPCDTEHSRSQKMLPLSSSFDNWTHTSALLVRGSYNSSMFLLLVFCFSPTKPENLLQ